MRACVRACVRARLCVCVCVCARARARARVCVCVCAYVLLERPEGGKEIAETRLKVEQLLKSNGDELGVVWVDGEPGSISFCLSEVAAALHAMKTIGDC